MTRAGGGDALRRWPGLLLCALAGAAAGLAHPPVGFVPGLLGFAAVVLLLDRADPARPLRSGFARGWAAGFGYLAVSTSWIGEPFFVDAAAHAWQAPFALVLTPGLIALLWGLAGAAHRALAPAGPGRVWVFASVVAAAEWLRGHVLTGFPWDLPGEVWRAGSAPSQAAALVGSYGLGWLTLAAAAAPAALFGPGGARARAATAAAGLAILAGVYGYGEARLHAHPPAPSGEGVRLRLVQPDLPEPAVVDEALVRFTLARYLRLTVTPPAPGERPPQVVVWPEGAIPGVALDTLLAPGSTTRDMLAGALLPGQVLLMGGVRVEPAADRVRYYNTLAALQGAGGDLRVAAAYDKHHLVPFGEYLPLQAVLTPLGLRKLISNPDDFDAGPPPRPIRLPLAGAAALVQPLICYEALFPAIAEHAPRAAWLVNISDDAWFGRHNGPWQHLNLASHRAIEEGLPMVRATPTGVSAVVDAYGRVTRGADGRENLLAPGRSGVVDATLPPPAPPTLYTRWRDAPYWVFTLGGLAFAARPRKLRRRRR